MADRQVNVSVNVRPQVEPSALKAAREEVKRLTEGLKSSITIDVTQAVSQIRQVGAAVGESVGAIVRAAARQLEEQLRSMRAMAGDQPRSAGHPGTSGAAAVAAATVGMDLITQGSMLTVAREIKGLASSLGELVRQERSRPPAQPTVAAAARQTVQQAYEERQRETLFDVGQKMKRGGRGRSQGDLFAGMEAAGSEGPVPHVPSLAERKAAMPTMSQGSASGAPMESAARILARKAEKEQTLLDLVRRMGGISEEKAIAEFGSGEARELKEAIPNVFKTYKTETYRTRSGKYAERQALKAPGRLSPTEIGEELIRIGKLASSETLNPEDVLYQSLVNENLGRKVLPSTDKNLENEYNEYLKAQIKEREGVREHLKSVTNPEERKLLEEKLAASEPAGPNQPEAGGFGSSAPPSQGTTGTAGQATPEQVKALEAFFADDDKKEKEEQQSVASWLKNVILNPGRKLAKDLGWKRALAVAGISQGLAWGSFAASMATTGIPAWIPSMASAPLLAKFLRKKEGEETGGNYVGVTAEEAAANEARNRARASMPKGINLTGQPPEVIQALIQAGLIPPSVLGPSTGASPFGSKENIELFERERRASDLPSRILEKPGVIQQRANEAFAERQHFETTQGAADLRERVLLTRQLVSEENKLQITRLGLLQASFRDQEFNTMLRTRLGLREQEARTYRLGSMAQRALIGTPEHRRAVAEEIGARHEMARNERLERRVGMQMEFGKFAAGLTEVSEKLQLVSRVSRDLFLAGTASMAGMLRAGSPVTWNTLTGSLRLLAGEVGQTLIPRMLDLAEGVQKAYFWFRDLDDSTKGVIGNVIVYGTAVAGGVWAIGRLTAAAAAAARTLGLIGAWLGLRTAIPVGGAVAAGAAGAALSGSTAAAGVGAASAARMGVRSVLRQTIVAALAYEGMTILHNLVREQPQVRPGASIEEALRGRYMSASRFSVFRHRAMWETGEAMRARVLRENYGIPPESVQRMVESGALSGHYSQDLTEGQVSRALRAIGQRSGLYMPTPRDILNDVRREAAQAQGYSVWDSVAGVRGIGDALRFARGGVNAQSQSQTNRDLMVAMDLQPRQMAVESLHDFFQQESIRAPLNQEIYRQEMRELRIVLERVGADIVHAVGHTPVPYLGGGGAGP